MGVAGSRPDLSVSKELADHRQAFTQGQRPRREAVTEVMEPNVLEACPLANHDPLFVQVAETPAGRTSGNHPGNAGDPRNRRQHLSRRQQQRHPPRPGLRVAKSKLPRILPWARRRSPRIRSEPSRAVLPRRFAGTSGSVRCASTLQFQLSSAALDDDVRDPVSGRCGGLGGIQRLPGVPALLGLGVAAEGNARRAEFGGRQDPACCAPCASPDSWRVGRVGMMEDHRRLVLAGQSNHALAPFLLGRGTVRGRPAPSAEEQQIVAAEKEEALGAQFEEMRAEVLHVEQGVLLPIHWIGLAGPVTDLAGVRIEHGHKFRVRTCLGAGGPATMGISYPLFLVAFSIEVDAEGEEAGSLSRGIKEIPSYNRMYRRFRMWDQLAQVALPGVPASLSVVGARQGGSDEPAGRDREGG